MPRLKNPNHEKFAKIYAKDLANPTGKVSATKAYKQVYAVQQHTANTNATRLLNDSGIQLRIEEIIAKYNPPDEISKDIAELRKATKQIFDPEGNLVEVRDNAARAQGITIALKGQGAMRDNVTNIDNRSITSNITPDSINALSSIIQGMKALSLQLKLDTTNTNDTKDLHNVIEPVIESQTDETSKGVSGMDSLDS